MIFSSLPSVNNHGLFDKIVPMKKGLDIVSGNWVFDIANEDWAFDVASGNRAFANEIWAFDITSGNWAFLMNNLPWV